MVDYGLGSYHSDHVYEVSERTLAGFNFTVTDAATGLPVSNARCNIHAGINGTGDTDGGYTDANGIFGIDAIWFVPNSWSVSKEGYVSQVSNNIGPQIPVALIVDPTSPPPTDTLIETYRNIDIMRETVTSNIYFRYEGTKYGFSPNTQIDVVRTKIDELLVAPPPNGDTWPYLAQVHVFDNVKLKAEWWDIQKSRSQAVIGIDTNLLLGARLEYVVQYVQGMPLGEIAKIGLDGVNLVNVSLNKGEAKTGIIDLTGRIGEIANVSIGFDSFPGIWSEVLFDIWLVLGYSEDPPVDPTTPFNWEEFISKYGSWIVLGGAGIILLALYRRPSGQPIIVIPGTGGK